MGRMERSFRDMCGPLPMNRDLTTSEVAKLSYVCPRTVTKWCDKGLLKHYRIASGHRRITKQDLLDFLKAHGVPINEVPSPPHS